MRFRVGWLLLLLLCHVVVNSYVVVHGPNNRRHRVGCSLAVLVPETKSNHFDGLRQRTDAFLDQDVGTLAPNDLSCSVSMLQDWARTSCLTGATAAENILTRLEEESKAGNQNVHLSTTHYATVVDAWVRSDALECGGHAQNILDRLDEMSSSNNNEMAPNRVILNSVIQAWVKEGNTSKAEHIFERMRTDPLVRVEVSDYNALLAGYARVGDADKAESLLAQIVAPDTTSYNCLLNALARSDAPDAAERAQSILDGMERDESGVVKPDSKSYQVVASAWTKSGDTDRARALIQRAQTTRGVALDVYMHNALLDLWAESNHAQQAQDALFGEMEQTGEVSTVSYNTVIKAWCHSAYPDAPQKAESILNRMQATQSSVAPDVVTFSSVIDCYAKSGQDGVADKAIALFERMVESYRNGNVQAKPNEIAINCVLDALAQSGAAEQAERFLNRVKEQDDCFDKVVVDTISYSTVMNAFAKSGRPQKAQDIFLRMQEEAANGNQHVAPSTQTMNTLLNAWVQSGLEGSAQHAENWLQKMEASTDPNISPNVVSFSIVMNGWSKVDSPDAIERTRAVFDRMVRAYEAGNEAARPGLHSYSALMQAVTRRSRGEASAKETERLLREMFQEYKNGNESAKPNTLVMTLAIDTWAKSGAPDAGERAEALLDWMIELYETHDHDESFQPNERSFSATMNAWAKSRRFGKTIRAKAVMDRMVRMYNAGEITARPNTHIYTTMLNACAYTVGDAADKLESLGIANKAFRDLATSGYGRPNHVTYGEYIAVCGRLIDDYAAKEASIEAVFKRCCADGQLETYVVDRALKALGKERVLRIFRSALGDESAGLELESLPRSWRQNVIRQNQEFDQRNKRR